MILLIAGCAKTSTATPYVSGIEETPVSQGIPIETMTIEESVIPTPCPELIPCTIAFDTDVDGNREIYSMASDGSSQVNLSNNPADDFDPAWSPDGSQIAFVSNRENEDPGQYIYVLKADGSNVWQLTYEGGSDFPDWSHDGSALTYTSNKELILIIPDAMNNREVIRQAIQDCDGVLTVLVLWGTQHYSTGTAQAVLDYAKPGARLSFSCGWHITHEYNDVLTPSIKRERKIMCWLKRIIPFVEIDDQIKACQRIFTSETRWMVVLGSDLEEGGARACLCGVNM